MSMCVVRCFLHPHELSTSSSRWCHAFGKGTFPALVCCCGYRCPSLCSLARAFMSCACTCLLSRLLPCCWVFSILARLWLSSIPCGLSTIPCPGLCCSYCFALEFSIPVLSVGVRFLAVHDSCGSASFHVQGYDARSILLCGLSSPKCSLVLGSRPTVIPVV